MSRTLADLARRAEGTLRGDGGLEIHAARPLAEAREGEITLVEKLHTLPQLHESLASAVVLSEEAAQQWQSADNGRELSFIVAADPFSAFVAIAEELADLPPRRELGIHPAAFVSPSARFGANVNVFPGAFIDEQVEIGEGCDVHSGVRIGRGCRLGRDVVLHPNVVLYPSTVLGDRVVIHAGSVIGADGFGYRFRDGRHVKVPQLGAVRIGNDVEIGACTTIDRATFGTTVIGDGTKIDNLVQVGHNCQIGRHNLLVSQTGFAGSCTTGEYVVTAGQAGIRDHVRIGSGTRIGAKAGVMGDVPEKADYVGAPATPVAEQKRIILALARLPELRQQLRELQREIDRLSGGKAERNDGVAEAPARHARSVVRRSVR